MVQFSRLVGSDWFTVDRSWLEDGWGDWFLIAWYTASPALSVQLKCILTLPNRSRNQNQSFLRGSQISSLKLALSNLARLKTPLDRNSPFTTCLDNYSRVYCAILPVSGSFAPFRFQGSVPRTKGDLKKIINLDNFKSLF